MRQRAFIAAMITHMGAAMPLAVVVAVGCLAGEIRKGATVEVTANSIWFQDAAKLAHWQLLRKSGDPTALASYQREVLGNRDAWQFTVPLPVKILSYDPGTSQVDVEMTTPGRLQGSTWVLDTDSLAP